jgi:dolichol-phosphate mannosyltransferase
MRRILIIIPTYNEIENISHIIRLIFSDVPEANILVIDDNSPDGTGKYVEELSKKDERVKIIHRERKLGLGSAYKLGFKYAIKEKYDLVFEMDADFSHHPKDIKRFLQEIENCDLVIGSRYLKQVTVINWPLSRLLLSYFANLYARIITGIPVRDLTSGFKCYKIEVIKAFPLHRITSEGYGFQIETVFWAYCKKFKIREIPIVFTDRVEGSSKMSKKIVWEAFWLVWRLKIIGLFHRYG